MLGETRGYVESSEETRRDPRPLLPQGLFWDLEPSARQACPPALQLTAAPTGISARKAGSTLLHSFSYATAEAFPVPFVKAVG